MSIVFKADISKEEERKNNTIPEAAELFVSPAHQRLSGLK
jgi:hypothetical protein